MQVDWDAIKVQYELFGVSLTELADSYGLSLAALEYAKEQKGWSEPDTMAVATADDLVERAQQLSTLKNHTLFPKYVMLESMILSKAIDLAATLTPENPATAPQLKLLTDIIGSLKESNGQGKSAAAAANQERVVVNILNQV